MRKKSPKLVLRKETLRALTNLQLAHVAAGQETDALVGGLTHDNVCLAANAQKA